MPDELVAMAERFEQHQERHSMDSHRGRGTCVFENMIINNQNMMLYTLHQKSHILYITHVTN